MHDQHADQNASLPTDRRALLAGIGGLAAGALLAGSKSASAGPLTPPPGPITSTGKTLTEVEPRIAINSTNTPGESSSIFRITQPGSYYLTGNLTGQAAKHGILISASNVTIDFNGFSLIGIPGALRGIATDGTRNNLIIRNGTVINWPTDGIAISSASIGCILEQIHFSGNGGNGVSSPPGAIISQCTATSNSNNGFNLNPGTTVSHCIAAQNGATGFGGSTACTFESCIARENGSSGFFFSGGCTLLNCSSRNNGTVGFNGTGVGTACTLQNCAAVENLGDGYVLQVDCLLTYCTSRLNGGNGYTSGFNLHISNCSATSNTLNGIRAGGARSQILNNLCSSNGNGGDGAGILVAAGDSRVEGNNSCGNDRGIDVDGSNSFIIRNTCSGNTTNWTIVANNVCGPILDRTAPASAAISGNSAPSSLGSTDPNANFTY